MTVEDRTALVTGASSGIGAAIVRRLRADGGTVWALGRNGERLAALAAETGCLTRIADLRDLPALRVLINEAQPDIVICNAGTGAAFTLLAAEAEAIAETIETNLTATLQLLRLSVPAMRARGRGHVVTIGSVAGLHTVSSTVYAASKAAIHRLSQALRLELQGSGVRVTEICPGLVDTPFLAATIPDPEARQRFLGGAELLHPEDVADAVHYALCAPARVDVALIELLPTGQSMGGAQLAPRPSGGTT